MVINSIIWDVEPNIFHLGFFSLTWYKLLVITGLIIGYFVLKNYFDRERIPIRTFNHLILYLSIGALFGARLGYCFFYNFEYYMKNPIEVLLPFISNQQSIGIQGLASHGAALGLFISLLLFATKHKISFFWLLDKIVILSALGFSFVRLGNLMHSSLYGIETQLPWGFVFIRNNETISKHPTQLYEGLSYLLIFVSLYLLVKKKGHFHKDGIVFSIFSISLFSVRFLTEFLKEGQIVFDGGLRINMAQLLSIPIILTGIISMAVIFLNTHNEKN